MHRKYGLCLIDIFSTHNATIINYFNNRLTNASAESFNAKIKDLRRQFRGINDTAFILFRLSHYTESRRIPPT